MPGDLAAAGTPSNLGRIGETGTSIRNMLPADVNSRISYSALADTDPLGVNMNVSFDEVGGLDDCELIVL